MSELEVGRFKYNSCEIIYWNGMHGMHSLIDTQKIHRLRLSLAHTFFYGVLSFLGLN